ncbi:hypothetical protein Goshw_002164 [Gossypium schwendimanii]|uniref:Hexosyltransferase n=1 Tax=Gossypium schwendimanii TaxID=34291 RepID=A0A7J9L720_GOSSC|nr:hypothetical protein [Gossypium schwendimanii]
MGTVPEPKGIKRTTAVEAEKLKLISEGCNPKAQNEEKHVSKHIIGEVFKTHHAIQTLDKTILNLEMELAAARAAQDSLLAGSPLSTDANRAKSSRKRKYLMDHVEGYLELSAKPKIYFATALALWEADFYVKVDENVHVNIETLVRHRKKHRVLVGCTKSGPVLSQKGVRCNEPEYRQFGESGNKYFRHATRKLYAISKDLASYISINQHVLHKSANEDVSLGSWFIGLDVQHIDDRRLCCGRPPVEGPKLAMLVLLPLIRAAVEFASMLIRLKRFISSAGKERMLCGVLLSNGSQHPVFFLTQEDGMHGESSNTKSFFCSLMKRKENIIRDSETPLKNGRPLQY